MSAEAEAAAQRYAMLIASFKSLYQDALGANDFGLPKQMDDLRESAYRIAKFFLNSERTHIASVFAEIASDARTATVAEISATSARDDENAAGDSSEAISQHLQHELLIQIERDIVMLTEALRRAWLTVSLAARSRGTTMRSALATLRFSGGNDLQFFFHDRSNNKWPSLKFVRAVWRQHLLAEYNETVLHTLADHGLETAEITHINPKADSHGMLISLSPGAELPTYGEIRDAIFHPNSDAILHKAPD